MQLMSWSKLPPRGLTNCNISYLASLPSYSLFMPLIHLLTRRYANRQMILRRRDRTRRVIGEHTRPVVRFVEIENHPVVRIGQGCVEMTSDRVGRVAVRLICTEGFIISNEPLSVFPPA